MASVAGDVRPSDHQHEAITSESPDFLTISESKSEKPSRIPVTVGLFSPEESAPIQLLQFPDSGAKAWQQVLTGFLLMFSSWGLINAFGVFEAYYSLDPPLSNTSSISWIGSVQICLLFLTGPISGRAVDAGYAKSMTIVGSVLIVISYIAVSFSGANKTSQPGGHASLVYWQIFLLQGVVNGIGMGLVFMPSISIPATYFVKRRAFALGVVTCGATLGGISYPIAFDYLLHAVGFRWAVRVIGLLALVTLSTACLLLRQRTDLPKKSKGPLLEFRAFGEPRYALLVAGMACSFVGFYVPYYFVQTRVHAANVNLHGLPSFYLVTFLNVGGLFGRLAPNLLADRFNPIFVHAIFVFIGGILILCWPFATSLASLIVFTLMFGFFSGAFASMPAPSVASITEDMGRYGARFGMAIVCNGFAVLVGPPIAGAIIESGRGYVMAAVFASVVVIGGALGLGAAGILKSRNLE